MIDTEVKGSVSQVKSSATWLRDTLAKAMSDGADDVTLGRRLADSEWGGISGNAYSNFAKTLIEHGDDHAARVKRAAQSFDDYAAHLKGVKQHMGDLRGQATAGGLTVAGFVIKQPPAAPGYDDLPAGSSEAERSTWEQEKAAHDRAVDKIELYDRLVEDVAQEYERHQDWIEANLHPARDRARDDGGAGALVVWFNGVWGPTLRAIGLELGEHRLGRMSQEQLNQAREHRKQARKIAEAARSRNRERARRASTDEATARRDGHHADARRAADNADLLRRGAKFLGPLGYLADGWGAYQDIQDGESPTGTILKTAAGIGAGALVVAAAPVGAPVVLVGAAAIGAGILATEGAEMLWDALPDDFTNSVDDAVSDAAGAVGDAVSDGWDKVTGWF